MLQLALPWWEFLIRGSVVYLALFLLLRFGGKRKVGQMTPFDLVLLMIVSNAVQNAMIGPDTSLAGGLIVAATLALCDFVLNSIAVRNRKLEHLLEGRAEIIVHNGKIDEDVLKRQKITHDELKAALRRSGCFDLHEVEFAILETNGMISVKQRETKNSAE